MDSSLLPRFLAGVPAEKRDVFTNAFILKDSDGQLFINYMMPIHDKTYNDCRREFPSRHRQVILDGREGHLMNPSVMTKLAWLERYHNFILLQLDSSLPDLVIGFPSTQGFDQIHIDQMAQQGAPLDGDSAPFHPRQ